MKNKTNMQQQIDIVMNDDSLTDADKHVLLASMLLHEALLEMIEENKPVKSMEDYWNKSRFFQN